MTTDELEYYFGVSGAADVPEYDVVTLSDPADQPDCTFFAFGRLVSPTRRCLNSIFFFFFAAYGENYFYS